ncbi:MAG: MoaD/ThiS family protein [Vulcanimicrobiota bacterium]
MATVRFTNHLKRFFPDLTEVEVACATVAELVAGLDQRYPGLAGYLLDDRGRLRGHVNVFVDGSVIADRANLSDTLTPASEVHIMQALSGG